MNEPIGGSFVCMHVRFVSVYVVFLFECYQCKCDISFLKKNTGYTIDKYYDS